MKQTPFYAVFTVCLLIYSGVIHAQLPEESAGYKDFAQYGNDILLLTSAGKLKLIDAAVSDSGQWIPTDAPVVAMSFDRRGTVIVGDTNHLIKSFDFQQKTWRVLTHYTGKLTGIIFNSQNQCLIITNRGIVDTPTNQLYFPESALYQNNQIRNWTQWFGGQVYFIDDQDRIWIGCGYGEWGGDIFVFDALHKQYLRPQLGTYPINLNPVQAFAQGGNTVFMTTGMAHFTTHGSLVAFHNLTARVVLESKSRWKPISATRQVMEGGEYIGPVAYNPRNRCVYFYSQHGIFKGNPTGDLSILSKWTFVVKPELQWTQGQPNAVGPAMNVLKMQFTPDGKLIFLTEHDGLGIYDGAELRFIR